MGRYFSLTLYFMLIKNLKIILRKWQKKNIFLQAYKWCNLLQNIPHSHAWSSFLEQSTILRLSHYHILFGLCLRLFTSISIFKSYTKSSYFNYIKYLRSNDWQYLRSNVAIVVLKACFWRSIDSKIRQRVKKSVRISYERDPSNSEVYILSIDFEIV